MKKILFNSIFFFLLLFAACSKEVLQSEISPNEPSPQENRQHNEKFGLAEFTRRDIYHELEDVESNARLLAKKRFPGRGSFILMPESPLAKKREGITQSILANAYQEIAKKYKVTVEQVQEILQEGKEAHWRRPIPLPRMEDEWRRMDRGWQIPPTGSI